MIFSNRFAVDLTLKDLTLGCNMAKDFNYTPIFSQKSRELLSKKLLNKVMVQKIVVLFIKSLNKIILKTKRDYGLLLKP